MTMTNTSSPLMRGAAAALILTCGMPGCDASDVGVIGESPVGFRDGDGTWGPGKLNTNFLGEDGTYPLNTLPLVDEPGAAVRLHAVWTTHCIGPREKTLKDQLFYASGINGELGIHTTDGDLEPASFKLLTNPSVTCTVAGDNWENTVWGVITTDSKGIEKDHYLMILDRGLDNNGNPVFQWGVFTGLNMAELFNPSQYKPTCAEDVDPFGDAYLLREHAYLVADLAVDPQSGDFSVAPNAMYLACRAGAAGKSISWGYPPWTWGTDIHELATRVVRADYCGSGKSFTVKGNALFVRDQLGVNDFTATALDDEAAWDLATSRATCVTLPRDHAWRVGFTTLDCGDHVLPVCSPEAMASSIFATKVAD